jgi:hypothetical protein
VIGAGAATADVAKAKVPTAAAAAAAKDVAAKGISRTKRTAFRA